MASDLFHFAKHFITSSQLRPLPLPQTPQTNRTVIVTGANTGLGLEAARHFARLGAGRVILACRRTAQGAQARRDILQSLGVPDSLPVTGEVGGVEVWPLDLASFESVLGFCERAERELLDGVDVLLMNAAVVMGDRVEMAEGWEMTVTVNVIGTFLVVVRLLGLLKRAAKRGGTEAVVTVVGSEAHSLAKFPERSQPRIFEALRTVAGPGYVDRYGTSKLIDILVARELAERLNAAHGDRSPVTVNIANPGLCKSSLFRNTPFYVRWAMAAACFVLGRTSEVGSRALLAAATMGRTSHGRYVDSGRVDCPSAFVMSWEGRMVQPALFDELMEILESIAPGVTGNITDK
ncbi:NAD(P)-binding protein [Trichocladium antarcticum]|uniref:NAD(P)-binding protein n=1 Tax=Trichocladium antarcticum TaxID=1450529 RepID=A0AAN6ZID2_9PEZI|nr:NAD(P)-binding protein [Trichocladium antarcticum]